MCLSEAADYPVGSYVKKNFVYITPTASKGICAYSLMERKSWATGKVCPARIVGNVEEITK